MWWDRWRTFCAETCELQERLLLINRPWEEELLHWAGGEDEGRLHGRRVPPPGRRRHSVTSRGWCPGGAVSAGPGALGARGSRTVCEDDELRAP